MDRAAGTPRTTIRRRGLDNPPSPLRGGIAPHRLDPDLSLPFLGRAGSAGTRRGRSSPIKSPLTDGIQTQRSCLYRHPSPPRVHQLGSAMVFDRVDQTGAPPQVRARSRNWPDRADVHVHECPSRIHGHRHGSFRTRSQKTRRSLRRAGSSNLHELHPLHPVFRAQRRRP